MTTPREIANLFQEHRDELGFVNVAQVREKTTYVERRDGDVVGAILCNHCVQKTQTTLYDIAVSEEYRRSGIGGSLVESMANDSPHNVIVAKCPTNLDANKFYQATGWQLSTVERRDEKRDLNVWEYEI